MKSRPIQALESNLGSRFLLRASRPRGIRNRQSRPHTGAPSSRLTLATKPYGPGAGCYEHTPRYTWAAMQEPVCGLPLKMGARCRLRGVDACRHAGPTVPQSSIVGSTDDCHISPPIAKPKAARQRRADRLPDDVVAITKPSWKLGSVCQMMSTFSRHSGSRLWTSQLGGLRAFAGSPL
jgi:hypothetical protein